MKPFSVTRYFFKFKAKNDEGDDQDSENPNSCHQEEFARERSAGVEAGHMHLGQFGRGQFRLFDRCARGPARGLSASRRGLRGWIYSREQGFRGSTTQKPRLSAIQPDTTEHVRKLR